MFELSAGAYGQWAEVGVVGTHGQLARSGRELFVLQLKALAVPKGVVKVGPQLPCERKARPARIGARVEPKQEVKKAGIAFAQLQNGHGLFADEEPLHGGAFFEIGQRFEVLRNGCCFFLFIDFAFRQMQQLLQHVRLYTGISPQLQGPIAQQRAALVAQPGPCPAPVLKADAV